jgi:hypothetical protein
VWIRVARWAARHLPLAVLLNPFEIFLGGLCVLSGVPFLLTLSPRPGTLEELLPAWLVFAWGLELVCGGALVVIGVTTERRAVERFGLFLLGPAALVYAIGIIYTARLAGLVAAAIVAAFGLACLLRLVTLTSVRSIVLDRVADTQDSL